MDDRKLQPMSEYGRVLYGPKVKECAVGSLSNGPDDEGPCTEVALILTLTTDRDVVWRLKSPQCVDQLIQMLLRHKRDVWPDAP